MNDGVGDDDGVKALRKDKNTAPLPPLSFILLLPPEPRKGEYNGDKMPPGDEPEPPSLKKSVKLPTHEVPPKTHAPSITGRKAEFCQPPPPPSLSPKS